MKESLAIVGIGCRYPGGVDSPESFWKMMASHTDAIIDVPKDRFDVNRFYDGSGKRPGSFIVKQGGFLTQSIEHFDPLFFGISPREASCLDPQQRLLLEVTWEAFEDAGLSENRFRGSNTGVFIGAFNLDNLLHQLSPNNLPLITSHTAASVTMTMLSNRISYTFDLQGPSVTLDTACSSSLVSTHFACQSIWNGDCDMVIAGGVNIIFRPEYMVSMSKGGFLSSHARCMAFDEDAKGYVRGEGAGVVVIKRLSKAEEDGDLIYAIIRNTGVNQDGNTPNGISFPNPKAQESLIRKVYREVGISPKDVQYIEAHGTGTQAGDPVEISAIKTVISEDRNVNDICYVGSVKTNIGHTESAAGIAGLIKAALSLKNKKILPNIHFNKPNPKINFDDCCLKVPTQQIEWPEGKSSRICSVNSFGYGGTNGHIVLQGLSDQAEQSVAESSEQLYLLPFSAKSEQALRDTCQRYLDFLGSDVGSKLSLTDLNHSLSFRRTHLEDRLALVVKNRGSLLDQLQMIVEEKPPAFSANGSITSETQRKLVFVFTGMGPQWWGMGREMYAANQVFRDKIDTCDAFFKAISGWSIRDALLEREENSKMANTSVAQPANFIIQAALLEYFKSWGIRPDAVVGHSVGEVAAAYASGALTLEDAIIVSYHRSRLQQSVAGQGTMLAVGVGEETAGKLIEMYDQVSIAAINSQSSVTLSGNKEQLVEIANFLAEEKIFNRMLHVEAAYHSYQMDPLKDELIEVLKQIRPKTTELPLYSTVTGKKIDGESLTSGYWWSNVRQPVFYARAINALIEDGYRHFIEIGPHPVTKGLINEALAEAKQSGMVFSSLTRKEPEMESLLSSVGKLYVSGYGVAWPASIQNGKFHRLPPYPWQKEHHWNESGASRQFRIGSGKTHHFLSTDLMLPTPAWQVDLNENFFPYIGDHRINNVVVFPGAAYIESGLAIHYADTSNREPCALENLVFEKMLAVSDETTRQMRITSTDAGIFSIYSGEDGKKSWLRHATGRIIATPLRARPDPLVIDKIKRKHTIEKEIPKLYESFSQKGLQYGEFFQGLKSVYLGNNSVLSRVQVKDGTDTTPYHIHPTLLDACFQSLIALLDNDEFKSPFVPISIGEINYYRQPGACCWCYGEILSSSSKSITCHLMLMDDEGAVLVDIYDLVCSALEKNTTTTEKDINNCFYEIKWTESDAENVPVDSPTVSTGSKWLLMGNKIERLLPLQKELENRGVGSQILALETEGKLPRSSGDRVGEFDQLEISDIEGMEAYLGAKLRSGVRGILYTLGEQGLSSAKCADYHATVNTAIPMLALAKALAKMENINDLRLATVTEGAEDVIEGDNCSALFSSHLSSLSLLLANEQSAIQPKAIDLSANTGELELKLLVDELMYAPLGDEVALRGQRRFVKSVSNTQPINIDRFTWVDADEGVEAGLTYGSVDTARDTETYHYQPALPQNAGRHQVRIRIDKQTIEPRYLKAIAQHTADTDKGLSYGVGTVEMVGADISGHGYQVGKKVLAILPSSPIQTVQNVDVKNCLVLNADHLARQSMDVIPYLTAIYLLDHVAKISEARSLLVVDGASTLGLALIDIAARQNVFVIAAADSPEKEQFLRAQGIEHIVDSGSISYVQDVLDATRGEGVDFIVGELDGAQSTRLLKSLRKQGTLLCLVNEKTPQSVYFPNHRKINDMRFAYVNIERLLRDGDIFNASLMNEVAEYWGKIPAKDLPKLCFSANEIGKVHEETDHAAVAGLTIIDFQNQRLSIRKPKVIEAIDKEGTYLITGGTRGLGLEIAKWLAQQGVKSLVLASRSGMENTSILAHVEAIQNEGARVEVISVDITSEHDVDSLVNYIQSNMKPLSGIFHCAMVLDDGLATEVDKSRFERVMRPKVLGAVNLHNATKKIPLKQFVSFSSISSLIGNAGQANYVAANSFLDHFSYYRRRLGLAATTINLGVLKEAGVVARDSNVAELLEARGIYGFTNKQVLTGIGEILNRNPIQIGLFDINWYQWAQENPKCAQSSRFRSLAANSKPENQFPAALKKLLDRLVAHENQESFVEEQLTALLAKVVRIPAERIKKDRSISELGIDSLMSTEYSYLLRSELGVEVSLMEILNGPSLEQLSKTVYAKIFKYLLVDVEDDDNHAAYAGTPEIQKVAESI